MLSEEQSFDVIYEQYFGRIRGYLLNALRDPATADDLAQDVFTRAWERQHLFDGRNLLGWLYRIAKNLVIDYVWVRQSRPQVSLDVTLYPLEAVTPPSWLLRLSAPTTMEPEAIVLEREDYDRLYAALRSLTPEHRTVVIALTGYAIPSSMLACHLGTTQMGVKAMAFRARDELRMLLLGKRRQPRYGDTWVAHELTCQQCGRPFEVHYRPRVKSVPRRHCSGTCRKRWAKNRERDRMRLLGECAA